MQGLAWSRGAHRGARAAAGVRDAARPRLGLVIFVRTRNVGQVLERAEAAFAAHPGVLDVERDVEDAQAMRLVVGHPQDVTLAAQVNVWFAAVYSDRAEAAGGAVADDAGLDALIGIRRELLNAGGEGLDYRIHVVPHDEALPAVPDGIVRYVRDTPEGRVVIDATSPDPEVARRFGPAGRIVAQGNDAERALMLIEEAMRWHVGVQIRRGVRVELDRLPPALAGPAAELEEAENPAIELQPAPDWSWLVVLHVRTDRGELDVPISLYEVDPEEGYDHTLRGVFHNLSFSMSQRREDDGTITTNYDWRLHPTDAPVRARLAALDFLYACSGRGQLEWESRIPELPSTTMTLRGDEFDRSLAFDRAFFADIVTIEEWTGEQFDLPQEASVEEVFAIAQAAATVRSRGCLALWNGSTWRIEADKAPELGESGDEDELPVPVEAEVFGTIVALGFGLAKARLTVTAIDPLPDDPDHVAVTFSPADDAAKIVQVRDLQRPAAH